MDMDMEHKETETGGIEHVVNVPRLTHKPVPDVPEDVDDVLMAHFNDPNYDISSLHSTRSSFSFELDGRREGLKSYKAESIGYSSGNSDVDTESQVDTTTRGATSRAQPDIEYNDESPYPEVRAAVSSIDDPTMPVSTFRMWILGIIYVILVSGLNQLFSMRYPSVHLSGLVAQLTALPAGKLLEWMLPRRRFRTFGYSWSMNPGPFNIKEHTVITVMANVVQNGAYATDVIATQRVFYNQNWSFGYQILMVLSSQLIGYSFAGLVRQFLVWPSSMIWPGALVNAALFNTLHKNYGKKQGRHMSREKFFLLALIGSFVWYWVPGFLWTGLSMFNWVCWIAPNNVVINQMFGTISGLGMGIFTFDWSMISYIGNPLVAPWWSEANTMASFVLWFWIITPILYYKNAFFSKFLPISAYETFDNTGMAYDVTRIVTNGVFDVEKYRAYSPLYMSVTFVLSYGVAFAAFTAVIVHTFLWYRYDIMRQLRRTVNQERDVHSRLMRAYPEAPIYWYGLLFLFAFVLGIIAIEEWPTELPVWAYMLSLLLALIFTVPTGIIQAITNQVVPISVMVELVVGYALPGKPVAMMLFKTYGYIAAAQAVGFAGDLKLGQYMKIPPRVMFLAQTLATTLSIFVVLGVQAWMFTNIPDFCTPEQSDGFVCPSTQTFASASLIWGGIGPARLFSKGALYYPFLWFFLLGALAPIPFYYLARRYPRGIWRYINIPVFFNGVGPMPPASGINFSSWLFAGFIFQFWARRSHFRWWMRYNYILAAALDSGVAFGIVVIFFTVVYPKGGVTLNWWGNTVWMNNLDAAGVAFKTVDPGSTFGPQVWS